MDCFKTLLLTGNQSCLFTDKSHIRATKTRCVSVCVYIYNVDRSYIRYS